MTSDADEPSARRANHVAHGLSIAARFALAAAGGFAGLVALGMWWGMPGLAVAAACYAAAALVTARALRTYPHRRLGACNVVTLIRLVLVCALVGLPPEGGGWAAVMLGSAALASDGIDGWLARRAGLASAFGARFDMEVDAGLALALAVHAAASGAAGAAVLALGLPRYAFWAAGAVWPWLSGRLPERFGRKAVCVVQIGVLIAVLVPGMPRGLADGLVAGAALLLAWSFWVDVRWLRRARG